MTDEQGKAEAADDKAHEAPAPGEEPAKGPDVAAEAAGDGAEGDLAATPVGHPPPTREPVVAAEARKRPTVRKGAKPVLLVYEGPADAFTTSKGIKFRPGVPTEVDAADADELLTFPHHAFHEAEEADEGADAKEQEKGNGDT